MRMLSPPAHTALTLFMAQLAANALWTWLFFAWRLGGAAFAEIVVLWRLIAATIAAFRRTNRTAAVLLLPYLGWVSYAAALNYAVWRMNRGTFGRRRPASRWRPGMRYSGDAPAVGRKRG